MSEPTEQTQDQPATDEQKPAIVPKEEKRLLGRFTRVEVFLLACSVVVGLVLGFAFDLAFDSQKRAELWNVRVEAYVSIAKFAPWNIAQQYAAIVFTQGNSYAESLAHQQEQQTLLFRGFACSVRGSSVSGGSTADNPCAPLEHPHGLRAFYLSAHVPFALRFITAFFDLLLHALVDQGLIGFFVATAQLVVGASLMWYVVQAGKIKLHSFYSYVLGVPLLILGLGSLAAIPVWLLALACVMVLKTFPIASVGAQLGGTGWLVAVVFRKTTEMAAHAAIMKQIERRVLRE